MKSNKLWKEQLYMEDAISANTSNSFEKIPLRACGIIGFVCLIEMLCVVSL